MRKGRRKIIRKTGIFVRNIVVMDTAVIFVALLVLYIIPEFREVLEIMPHSIILFVLAVAIIVTTLISIPVSLNEIRSKKF